MDAALLNAIDNQGLEAEQVLLPSGSVPRLSTSKLPLIDLTDNEFVNSLLLSRRKCHAELKVINATKKTAAKLLMTPCRDSTVQGRSLREAHRLIGHYLATEFVADEIDLEKYSMIHVQGQQITGYRLLHEKQTLIVALMRGGEPMALGVNDAFPLAKFFHANEPTDMKELHLEGQLTVVLVDSVVNSGKTIVDFVKHIRKLHATIRIAVVTAVAQAQSVAKDGPLQKLALHGKITLIALRISENKFTGRGTTDTGNRLFNTTHLD